MKNIYALRFAASLFFATPALAQGPSPGPGPQPTPDPWVVSGNQIKPNAGQQVQFSASTTGQAAFNIPCAVAPTSPVNGDMWCTASALFARVNGVTVNLSSFSPTVGTTVIGGSPTVNGVLYSDGSGVLRSAADVNNGVLVTNGSGVPAASTTLPSGLTIPSPTMSGTIAGNLTFSGGLVVGSATGGNQGNGTINAQGLFVNGVAVGSGGGGSVGASGAVQMSNGSGGFADSLVSIIDGGSGGMHALAETWPANQYLNGPIICEACTLPPQGDIPATDINHSTIYGRAITVSGANGGGRFLWGEGIVSQGHVNIMFGFGATCSSDNCINFGEGAISGGYSFGVGSEGAGGPFSGHINIGGGTIGGNGAINIGSTPQALATNAIALGANAAITNSSATGAIAVGHGSVINGAANNAIAIGEGATVGTGNGSDTVIGAGASTTTGGPNVVVGFNASATGRGIAVGMSSTATCSDCMALGEGANAGSGIRAVAIGHNATATAAGQLVAGGPNVSVVVNGDPTATAASVASSLQIASTLAAALTTSPGEISFPKISASGTAPGAGGQKFEAVAGTNSGSCKIITYAGTSNSPVTIVDNVGAGC